MTTYKLYRMLKSVDGVTEEGVCEAIDEIRYFNGVATKDDIKDIESRMATKDDIKDIESRMATKDDIKDIELRMATKDDISQIRIEIAQVKSDLMWRASMMMLSVSVGTATIILAGVGLMLRILFSSISLNV